MIYKGTNQGQIDVKEEVKTINGGAK